MKFDIDPKTYDAISRLIHSNDSPVGIDAKKTHILILNKPVKPAALRAIISREKLQYEAAE